MFYTYVLKNEKNGRLYTGATNDLRKFELHNTDKSTFTKKDKHYELIYYEAYKDKRDAFTKEKYLKIGPGKQFIKNRLKRFLTLTG